MDSSVCFIIIINFLVHSALCQQEDSFYVNEETMYPLVQFEDFERRQNSYLPADRRINFGDSERHDDDLPNELFLTTMNQDPGVETDDFLRMKTLRVKKLPEQKMLRSNSQTLDSVNSPDHGQQNVRPFIAELKLPKSVSHSKQRLSFFSPPRLSSIRLSQPDDNRGPKQLGSNSKRTSEEQLAQKRSSSGVSSCRIRPQVKLANLPGCVPKSVIVTKCQGTCHSRTVPDWNVQLQAFSTVRHCTCCAPNRIRFKTIVFKCPRRRRRIIKRLGYPFQCSCRPCDLLPEVLN